MVFLLFLYEVKGNCVLYTYKILFKLRSGWCVPNTLQQVDIARPFRVARAVPKQILFPLFRMAFDVSYRPNHGGEVCAVKKPLVEIRPHVLSFVSFSSLPS
jgi:hypothetical protein